MSTTPRVVIIGAGIVGANLADELTARGWTDVTVVDQGPLPLTGGSTSHAPGLVFQTNASKTMTAFGQLHRGEVHGLDVDGAWCFNQVGGLEVATTPERLADLHRRQGWATSWGVEAQVVDVDECVRLHPLLDRERILGGLHIPTDGLAKASRAVVALARRAESRGARASAAPPGSPASSRPAAGSPACGPPTATSPPTSSCPAPASGAWRSAPWSGCDVPLLPLAHQYVWTGQVPELVGRNDELERGEPADPAPPGPGPVLPRARRPHRHRLLRPPADAGRPARAARRSTTSGRRRCPRCCPSPRRTSPRRGSRAGCCCPRCGRRRSTPASTASSPSPRTAGR